MINFDLTPLIAKSSNKIIMRLAVWAAPVVLLALGLGYHEFGISLFRGVVMGLLDTMIMFAGIKKALPYVAFPSKGLGVMRRYKLYRLLSAGSIILLMLKLKYPVFGVCVGFLLIHIFLIINLIFIASRLNKAET
ncbi:hypothetical protein [uncultured Phascolarctobacterium sp.]|uniref:hypothetical protein n=1 Tax=Phascolarctobacterium sp. TaxID=2049039 RepID=UPI0025E64DB3|nr:hypothetical protein [uncultured Phascolarctobacterium sp.]